jgi:hypothetical protein
MKCAICDRELSEKEISFNEDINTFEPCTTCLDIAMDAAYCDGFTTEDDEYILLDDEELDNEYYRSVVSLDDNYSHD